MTGSAWAALGARGVGVEAAVRRGTRRALAGLVVLWAGIVVIVGAVVVAGMAGRAARDDALVGDVVEMNPAGPATVVVVLDVASGVEVVSSELSLTCTGPRLCRLEERADRTVTLESSLEATRWSSPPCPQAFARRCTVRFQADGTIEVRIASGGPLPSTAPTPTTAKTTIEPEPVEPEPVEPAPVDPVEPDAAKPDEPLGSGPVGPG